MLMAGSQGAGKTLLARALPSILPAMSFEEDLGVTSFYGGCRLFHIIRSLNL